MRKRRKSRKNSNVKQNSRVTSSFFRHADTKKRVNRYLNVNRSVLIYTANKLRTMRSKSVDTSYLTRPLLPKSFFPLVTRSTVSSPARNFDTSSTYSLGSNERSSVVKCRVKIADSVRRSNFFRAKRMGDAQVRPAHNQTHSRSC